MTSTQEPNPSEEMVLHLHERNFAQEGKSPRILNISFAPDGYADNNSVTASSLVIAPSSVISPDGRYILYSGEGRLWLRLLGDESARELLGTEGALSGGFFWSPDSLSVVFATRAELKRISIVGGDPTTLCSLQGSGPNSFHGGTWSPDGERIVFSSAGGLYETRARGGEPKLLFEPGDGPRTTALSPHFLPDRAKSQRLVYAAARPGLLDQMLTIVDLETGERRELVPGSLPFYSSDGYLFHGSSNLREPGLRALPLSLDTFEPTGQSFPVEETGRAASVSLDGTLVYTDRPVGGARQIVVRDRSGKIVQTVGDPIIGASSPAISPDGRAAAIEIAGDIWVYDLGRGVRTRLTSSH